MSEDIANALLIIAFGGILFIAPWLSNRYLWRFLGACFTVAAIGGVMRTFN